MGPYHCLSNSTLAYVSEGAAAAIGRTPEEMMMLRPEEYIHDGDIGRLRQVWQDAITSYTPVPRLKYRALGRIDGAEGFHEIPVAFSIYPLFGTDGVALGYYGMIGRAGLDLDSPRVEARRELAVTLSQRLFVDTGDKDLAEAALSLGQTVPGGGFPQAPERRQRH